MDQTLYSLYNAYISQLTKPDLANLNTSLIKYFLPAFGFKPQSNTRRTEVDTTNAIEKMKTISVSEFQNAINIQQSIFDKLHVKPIRQKQPRSYLKKMLSWAKDNDWFEPISETNEADTKILLRKSRLRKKFPRISLTSKGKLRPYALMAVEGDYINTTLATELSAFQSFCIDELNLKDSSWEKQLKITKQLLGFWHRGLNIPLESLSLYSIIPMVKLQYTIADFNNDYDQWCIGRMTAQDKIKAHSKVLIENLKALWAYLKENQNYKFVSTNYQVSFICSLINIVKFIYSSEVDLEASNDYNDIYFIRRLHVYIKNLNKKDKGILVVPIENKTVHWTTVISVLESSRQDCLQTVYEKGKYSVQRPVERIAKSLQTFLMLGLLVLIPPDRQQMLRSISFIEDLNTISNYERTNYLLHGRFDEDKFIPLSLLNNPQEAEWYIYMSDYKTSKTYGVMIATLPNTPFSDGTTFYQYLERWFYSQPITRPMLNQAYNLRDALEPLTDKCFMAPTSKKALTAETVHSIITKLFHNYTGVQVNPHTLRHIFSTYLDELESKNLLTAYERECIAFWMKHSLAIHKKTYNHTKQKDKLSSGSRAMERIMKI